MAANATIYAERVELQHGVTSLRRKRRGRLQPIATRSLRRYSLCAVVRELVALFVVVVALPASASAAPRALPEAASRAFDLSEPKCVGGEADVSAKRQVARPAAARLGTTCDFGLGWRARGFEREG